MAMRGISDLDSVCLTEIFKNLQPLDLCSIRQCSKAFRDFIDDYFRSLYFVREQWLDLSYESNANVDTILNNFGKLVHRLKVCGNVGEPLVLDVIANNCCNILKCLSLNELRLHKIDMRRFAGVFDNLETLELFSCFGNRKCYRDFLLGHEYPNLKELRIYSGKADEKQDDMKTKVLKQFFMRKRDIKQLLLFVWISDDLLPLIAVNAAELEELEILMDKVENYRNFISLAQLRKLKDLKINFEKVDNIYVVALIKGLSMNNSLEILSIESFNFTTQFCDALSNLTNLKSLRLWQVSFQHLNDTKSIEMMSHKLSKLELVECTHFLYRDFFASLCKSDELRTIYIWLWHIDGIKNFIDQFLKDFMNGKANRRFVSGNPLYVHLHEEMFDRMKDLVTQENLNSIEKQGNIKIIRANSDVFPTFD